MIVFKSFVIPEGVTACRIALQTACACLYATHGPTMSGYKLHNWGFVMIVGCLVVSTEDSGLGTGKSHFQARDHRASLKRAGTVDGMLTCCGGKSFQRAKREWLEDLGMHRVDQLDSLVYRAGISRSVRSTSIRNSSK